MSTMLIEDEPPTSVAFGTSFVEAISANRAGQRVTAGERGSP